MKPKSIILFYSIRTLRSSPMFNRPKPIIDKRTSKKPNGLIYFYDTKDKYTLYCIDYYNNSESYLRDVACHSIWAIRNDTYTISDYIEKKFKCDVPFNTTEYYFLLRDQQLADKCYGFGAVMNGKKFSDKKVYIALKKQFKDKDIKIVSVRKMLFDKDFKVKKIIKLK